MLGETMASYGDYLKELERIADNDKREHIITHENEIKQLNAELAKLEDEKKTLLAELAKLRKENDNLTTELDRWNEYKRLVQLKNQASTEKEYQDIARHFRAMDSYKDSAKLASEYDKQYRVLKERREEKERIAREKRMERETEERQREAAEKQRLEREEKAKEKKKYIFFVDLSLVIGGIIGGVFFYGLTNEKAIIVVGVLMGSFIGYMVTVYFICENKGRKCVEEEKEIARERIEQSNKWVEQGLCRHCGGELSFFLRKCKSCGELN
jgi:hypothetical protein